MNLGIADHRPSRLPKAIAPSSCAIGSELGILVPISTIPPQERSQVLLREFGKAMHQWIQGFGVLASTINSEGNRLNLRPNSLPCDVSQLGVNPFGLPVSTLTQKLENISLGPYWSPLLAHGHSDGYSL